MVLMLEMLLTRSDVHVVVFFVFFFCFVFFFNDTATTEIYTLSLHDALLISVLAISNKFGGIAP